MDKILNYVSENTISVIFVSVLVIFSLFLQIIVMKDKNKNNKDDDK